MKIKMLKKKHLIEKSDFEESFSSGPSDNSESYSKLDMFKMVGQDPASQSAKLFSKITTDLDGCKDEFGAFNP